VKSSLAQKPIRPMAHERAILDKWTEDDGVYVTLTALRAPERRAPATATAAAAAGAGSAEALASLPLPTLR
jgi:hypothetical protein